LRHPLAGRIIERAGTPDRRHLGAYDMTITRSAGRAGALLIPIALILAACGGSTGSSAPSANGGTSGATATPAASTGDVSNPTAATPTFAIPSFDISSLTAGLDKVASYRVSITVGGVEQYKAVVVTKPVVSRDITVSGGTRFVVIGNEAWTADGSGPLTSVPSALATSMLAAFDPAILLGAFSSVQWSQSSVDKGTEQKNGVNAHHFLIDSTTLVGGLSGLPAGASINFWIADDGYLVAWESTGLASGGDTTIEVTGVNDPANKVDRPS
jgi:hypothetical protein